MLVGKNERVGVVVDDDDMMFTGKLNQSLVGLHLSASACRHVRIVSPENAEGRTLRLEVYEFLELCEVRLPGIMLVQVVVDNIGPQDFLQRGIGGIARIRHQNAVAGIYQCKRSMQYTFLRAY